jgi:predicted nuclease of predicted toxin-antitoxin system
MKFLVDMPLSPLLVEWLKEDGHDVVHASYIGLSQAPDEVIIQSALREDRIVLTADLDYARLLALADSEIPGIILLRGGNYNNEETLDLIKTVLAKLSNAQISNAIVVVDKKSIRRRQLPLI